MGDDDRYQDEQAKRQEDSSRSVGLRKSFKWLFGGLHVSVFGLYVGAIIVLAIIRIVLAVIYDFEPSNPFANQ